MSTDMLWRTSRMTYLRIGTRARVEVHISQFAVLVIVLFRRTLSHAWG